MKKVTYLVFASFISLAACKKNEPDPPPPAPSKANIMFVNACVGAESVNGKVRDTVAPSASNIAFLNNTGYVQVAPSANAKLSFSQSSTNLSLDSLNTTLEVNKSYSAFITGTINKPSALVLGDDLTGPSSGKAKIRLVHVSNDTLKLTASVDQQEIASNIAFEQASGFVEVTPSANAKITVGDPNVFSQILVLDNQNIQAGKIYTVIKTGIQGGTNNANYKLSLITNK